MAEAWCGTEVLVVDDDAPTRELIGGLLEVRGHACELADSAAAARSALLERDFALALCDIAMPEESGLQLARHIVAEHHDTAVVMVSSHDDPQVAESALAFGAYGYVIKPFRPKDLLITVSAALRRRDVERNGRRDREALEREALDLRTGVQRLRHSSEAADLTEADTVERLTRAISERSHETGDHLERVGFHAARLARELGLPEERCRLIQRASRLHDIGKVAIADEVLLKPGRLTAEERAHMERHSEIGHYVLSSDSDNELLRLAAEIALSHHERFDGHGYPYGRAGKDIPLAGRITAIADVFDALTSDRVYRRAFPPERAIELMGEERGGHFDPELLDVFLEIVTEEYPHQRQLSDSRVSA